LKTKYINLKEEYNEEKIKEAAQDILNGKLVIFPTETVYGIGANALNDNACKNIFKAKGRAGDNPLIVHVNNVDMIKQLVEEPNEVEKILISTFCPGPFTLILKAKNIIPKSVTAGLDTVGIRMPSNKIANKLIEYADVPIAAPSANVSGRPSGTKIEDILKEFDGKVSTIIDDGMVDIGLESTVVRVIDNKVRILRPGKITKEDIEKLGIEVEIDENILGKYDGKEKVLSPGMKYRHYAPNTKCMMVYSKNEEAMVNKINELINEKNALVVCRDKNFDKYATKNKIKMGNSLDEMAHNIFSILRQVDNYNVDIVIIEGMQKDGLGLALNNRLLRACEYNYIEI
jgi:sua5/yciO/yrdC/ywlC family protein